MSGRISARDFFLQNVPIPVVLVDREHTIVDCNEKWLGAVAAENKETVIGMSGLEFLPEDEHDRARERLDQVLVDNEPAEEREYFFKTIHGQTKKATGTIIPVQGAYAYITFKDISESTKAEVEREKRRRQIEELHDVSIKLTSATSETEICEYIVEAIENVVELDTCVVGLVKDGRFVTGAVSEDYPEDAHYEVPVEKATLGKRAYRNQKTLIVDDVPNHPEKRLETPFGSMLYVPIGEFGLVTAGSYEKSAFDETDGELVNIITSHAREAFYRVEREQRLREQRNELELLQSVFSRFFRHNIRNELQIIKSNAEVIAAADPSDRVQRGAQNVTEAADRLTRSTKKARQIEQIVREQRDLRDESLQQLVTSVVTEFREEYPEATIRTDIEDGEVSAITGFRKALEDAIENALVHNPSPVTVDITARKHDGTVTLHIEDDGQGIPENELEVLRENRETALKHGSGVGLWLMRWAVERSNGTLDIERTDDGTRVEIELPLKDSTTRRQ